MTLQHLRDSMAPEEFALWVAFYDLENQEQKKALKKRPGK